MNPLYLPIITSSLLCFQCAPVDISLEILNESVRIILQLKVLGSSSFIYCFMIYVFINFTIISGNFQLSPDFRQRASSNASSCGRLSPIQSIVGIENTWNYPPDLSELADNPEAGQTVETELNAQGQAQLDQLAGSLADELTLQQTDFFKGSV